MSWKRPTVLIVEEEQEMRNLLFDDLWQGGYQWREARNGDEAILAILQSMPDLIITDLRLPGGGVEYVSRLRKFATRCPIIALTRVGDAQVRTAVLRAGATAFFDKPVHLSELKTRVKELLGTTQDSEGGQ